MSAEKHDGVDFPFERFTDEERLTLERTWSEGRMRRYVTWLVDFAQRHRDEIMAAARHSRDPLSLLVATKGVMLTRASLNHGGEMEDQAREISKEIWYRGEKGDYDNARIQLDWAMRHADSWRKWRVREYLFAIEKRSDKLTEVLLGWNSGERAAGGSVS